MRQWDEHAAVRRGRDNGVEGAGFETGRGGSMYELASLTIVAGQRND